MDPNSLNQWWSLWTWQIVPGHRGHPPYATVKLAAAAFGRQCFGAATAMRVNQRVHDWQIGVRSEGHPVHDPTFVSAMHARWRAWVTLMFGPGSRVRLVTAKLEAGSRQDGTAAEQLVMLHDKTWWQLIAEVREHAREERVHG
jgi:hypothetical protein